MKAVTQHPLARRGSSGFTLVELIMAVAISGIVLASIIGTFLTFAIGARSVGAYTEMSQRSRTALEYFSRDIRATEDVRVANASTLVVVFPSSKYYTKTRVTYDFDQASKELYRMEEDSSGNQISKRVLLDGVERFTFSYFDPLGKGLSTNSASILLAVKGVQVDAELQRKVSKTEATDYIISARFMMRNRPVTE